MAVSTVTKEERVEHNKKLIDRAARKLRSESRKIVRDKKRKRKTT
jgi:hypothetical protein